MFLAHLVLGTLVGISFGTFTATVAVADDHSSEEKVTPFNTPIEYETVPQLFQEAVNYESGNFFRNQSLGGRLKLIFGVAEPLERSSFPENEIIRDAQLVDIFYQDYMQQQMGDAPIRTRDLENPYTTSVGSPEFSR
ncbi:MAG: hypothetical protein ACLFTJ_11175 [Halothece sp.]